MSDSIEPSTPSTSSTNTTAYIHPRREPFEHGLIPIPKLIFSDGTQTLGPLRDKLVERSTQSPNHRVDSIAISDILQISLDHARLVLDTIATVLHSDSDPIVAAKPSEIEEIGVDVNDLVLFLYVQSYKRLLPRTHKDSAAVADVWPSTSAFDGYLSALSPLQLVRSNSRRFMPSQADEEAHQLSYLQKHLANILSLLADSVEESEESLVLAMEKFEHLEFLIYFGEKGSERIPLSQAAPFFANSDPDMPAAPVSATLVHDWLLQKISSALEHISERVSAKENGSSSASDQDVAMADACVSSIKALTSARGPSFIEGISKSSYVKQASDLKGSSVKVINCHESVIYILAPLRYATIYGCSDTTIVLGAVGKAVRVEHCERVHVIVTMGNAVNRRKTMNASLQALKSAGVEGVMMDVWWGLVERESPGEYNWGGYLELMEMAKKHGLKVQAVMSFHQCGGNVGDSCTIPLPKWVVEEINNDPDLAYTDQWGRRNYEYLSLGVDTLPALKGRTPVQCYGDFMRAFRDRFEHLLGDTIVEIQVGMGPAGELRYPSYPEQNGTWKFPGIGAFQCYDKYMLTHLKAAAEAAGKPEWGSTGPTDAGHYNNWPEDTNFFRKEGGGWNSTYGEFFLTWYSQMLVDHGERILSSAKAIFENAGVKISVKIAGIHWHYGTRSHAPELTAGYYNTRFRNGYLPIAQMLARHSAIFNFTCIEMRDHEQPQDAQCAPEKLVRQVALATRKAQVPLAGENALPRYDEYAHKQILQASSLNLDGDSGGERGMCAFTYLRMNPDLFQPENWIRFLGFVKKMKEGKGDNRCWEEVEREAEHFVHVTRPLVQEAGAALMH